MSVLARWRQEPVVLWLFSRAEGRGLCRQRCASPLPCGRMRTGCMSHDKSRSGTRALPWTRRPLGAAGLTGRGGDFRALDKITSARVCSQVLSGGQAVVSLITCWSPPRVRRARGRRRELCVCAPARLCTRRGSHLYVPWSRQELLSWKQKLPLRATPPSQVVSWTRTSIFPTWVAGHN